MQNQNKCYFQGINRIFYNVNSGELKGIMLRIFVLIEYFIM